MFVYHRGPALPGASKKRRKKRENKKGSQTVIRLLCLQEQGVRRLVFRFERLHGGLLRAFCSLGKLSLFEHVVGVVGVVGGFASACSYKFLLKFLIQILIRRK